MPHEKIVTISTNFEDAINDVDTKEKNIPNKIKDINKKINLSIFFHQS